MSGKLEEVDQLQEAGDEVRVRAQLRRAFEQEPTLPVALAIIQRLRPPARQHAEPCRAWWLRSFTVEPLFPLLEAAALLEGLDLEQRTGDHNAYAQEILDPHGPLYRFKPDVVFLAVHTRDVLPELWDLTAGHSHADLQGRVEQIAADLNHWVMLLRSRTAASIVLFDFLQPVVPSDGMLDAQSVDGQSALIGQLNHRLRSIAASLEGIYVLPLDRLGARIGLERFFDERKWATVRMPFAAQHLWAVAQECLRVVLPLRGKVHKAVVVDLDNTLWGGVVGEDGPEGLTLGIEYPGLAFLNLQRVLLDLHRRGVILAIASKNNPADALEVLEHHPAMLLRPHHFASIQLGWDSKSRSLRAIAQELNIGTDSLVFVDDNPVEREEVRGELPEVLVIELPRDPMGFAPALRRVASLERLRVMAEDRNRGRQYAEQRARRALRSSAGTLEEFHRSLKMEVTVRELSRGEVPRVSQLTHKTNQFNLTTHRYDEASIARMLVSEEWRVFTYSVRDRFGDNGLVGVAILRRDADAWEIDTLLLSCRVIGRTVETGLLAHLVAASRASGARVLRGCFKPTAKNQPAAQFYAAHGFECVENHDGATLWSLELCAGRVDWPEWLAHPAQEWLS